jgi:MFS family permease
MVLIVGSFMSVLDTSIVNIAISRIQNEFGVTTDEVQWVANGYTSPSPWWYRSAAGSATASA